MLSNGTWKRDDGCTLVIKGDLFRFTPIDNQKGFSGTFSSSTSSSVQSRLSVEYHSNKAIHFYDSYLIYSGHELSFSKEYMENGKEVNGDLTGLYHYQDTTTYLRVDSYEGGNNDSTGDGNNTGGDGNNDSTGGGATVTYYHGYWSYEDYIPENAELTDVQEAILNFDQELSSQLNKYGFKATSSNRSFSRKVYSEDVDIFMKGLISEISAIIELAKVMASASIQRLAKGAKIIVKNDKGEIIYSAYLNYSIEVSEVKNESEYLGAKKALETCINRKK